MSDKRRHVLVGLAAGAAMFGIAAGCSQAAQAAPASAPVYYVDCSQAPAGAEAAGSMARPIASLEALNAIRFTPGTRILFKRGTTCYGSFKPAAGSSGTAEAPVIAAAYGDRRLPRPVIAAGCRETSADPDQARTEAAKTPTGISPYHSLCVVDATAFHPAAVHLFNVEYWELNGLELTNDGQTEAGRLGLHVQLEDFGVGRHYRINDVYVHHVRGYLRDVPGREPGYKATGGILFEVSRNLELPGARQKKTAFDDVVIENSEVYNVDGIGISNRSAWMCRQFGAPCGDYAPYKQHPDRMKDPVREIASEYFPSKRLVIRNNKIHNVGGDGLVVRTAAAPRIESNLLYDIWMRAPFWSAGAWAINTDDAVFQYNEVHGVRIREHLEPSDGMAFDADLGTSNTRFTANYSHDNGGGLMLFCGCGSDGLGNPGKATGVTVDNNLSVNDGRRIILVQGVEDAMVRNNLIVTNKPGLATPLIENVKYPMRNAVHLTGNLFVNTAGQGALYRTKNREASYAEIVWDDNAFIGYDAAADLAGDKYVRGNKPDRFAAATGTEAEALISAWFAASGFQRHKYQPSSAE